MNNLLFLIALFIATGKVYSQAVLPLYKNSRDTQGAYYKDTYNDLDKLLGTWQYSNGTTTLILILQKRTMQPFSDGFKEYTEDVIVGEYKYVENGVEKINTLNLISQNYTDPYDHNIVGNIIVGPNSQYCLNCGPNDRKILLGFSDPTREIFGFEPEMIFQRADEGGVQKLKLNSGQYRVHFRN